MKIKNHEPIRNKWSKWSQPPFLQNKWQSFRTKKDRKIELISAEKEVTKDAKLKIAVKVVDIFRNDTTKVFGLGYK